MKRKLASILTALALCLSLCPGWAFAVEEEPDGAGDPMPLSTGDIELTQGTRAIFTEAGCGGNCPGHRITQADSTTAVDATYVYVESGEHKVTFSGLNLTGANTGVMPGGTMHLTIDGSNSIAANNLAGIYVPETATLTIDGSGSLEVKSTSGAGIGGSRYALDNSAGDSDCGTVVINGGTITVTGGSDSAGIGGARGRSNSPGGNGGDVTINGGNVTVTGGAGTWGGSAIGGTVGTPTGCGGTLTIKGGHVTLTAKSQEKNAFPSQ